jgi:hypothetical protein
MQFDAASLLASKIATLNQVFYRAFPFLDGVRCIAALLHQAMKYLDRAKGHACLHDDSGLVLWRDGIWEDRDTNSAVSFRLLRRLSCAFLAVPNISARFLELRA